MRTPIIALLFLAVPLLAASVEEKALIALKAEYAKRTEDARRPVRAWYAQEVSKKEKAYLNARDMEGAALMTRERIATILCPASKKLIWTWTVDKLNFKKPELEFHSDGTGIFLIRWGKLLSEPRAFKWTFRADEITLDFPNLENEYDSIKRDVFVVKLDPTGTKMIGAGFTIRVKDQAAP